MEWDPIKLEFTGSIISTDEVSTARFVQQVMRDKDNGLHRDYMKYESDVVLSIISDDFIEQDMAERIVSSINV